MRYPQNFLKHTIYHISSVKCEHLNELLNIQENFLFKLIPRIRKQDMTCTTFNKIKVNKAKQLWSRDVSSAMKFYPEEKGKKEFNTTAAFIEIISKWFTLVTARTPRVALGKTSSNEEKETKFNSNIAFLQSVVELFREIKIGQKSAFKPVQSGIMITTSSIDLTKYFVNERKYAYVLSGRFT